MNIFIEIKRAFCKHEWRFLNERNKIEAFVGFHKTLDFACDKCGAVETVYSDDYAKWKFQQEHKGAKVNDE